MKYLKCLYIYTTDHHGSRDVHHVCPRIHLYIYTLQNYTILCPRERLPRGVGPTREYRTLNSGRDENIENIKYNYKIKLNFNIKLCQIREQFCHSRTLF
jgi:hypothetical protein